jgi:hypothetical protein
MDKYHGDFETYLENKSAFNLEETIRQTQTRTSQEATQAQVQQNWLNRFHTAAQKDVKVYDAVMAIERATQNAPIMREFIKRSDQGVAVMMHLFNNMGECYGLAQEAAVNPVNAIAKMALLAEKFKPQQPSGSPPPPQRTGAPQPSAPVGGNAGPGPTNDISKLSQAEFVEKRNKGEI